MKRKTQKEFWKKKPLSAMSQDEWESLCDRCGRCCLHKLEDPDEGGIIFTNISCRLLNEKTCTCRSYLTRQKEVSGCLNLQQKETFQYAYLPKSCAYRRLYEGRTLASWHPLISENMNSVHQAGISVRSKVVCESQVKESELHWHIVDWIDV